MKLTYEEYRKKVKGCWSGKNSGGSVGAPYECYRGVFDVTGYPDNMNGSALPNDDLDMQLLWLNAAEKYGRSVNSDILAEYWISGVSADLSEYGIARSNMRRGIIPPLSGYYNNPYKDSNGAFIFSEIWACLHPGCPINAVTYAYEDAIVDHADEGLYAAVFCTAIESAAFVESDIYKLIEIGLSYIPEDCGVAKGVKCVVDAYKSGLTWQEARKKVLKTVPGSFGGILTPAWTMEPDEPLGPVGYDAPSNIGIIIIGLLYGEGDFGKSICIAASCGEDADCTASTLGALLGIIGGEDAIGKKWLEPIGNKITTVTLNLMHGYDIPKTTDELTDRITRLVPTFLDNSVCKFNAEEAGYTIEVNPDNLMCHDVQIRTTDWIRIHDLLEDSPFTIRKKSVQFDVSLKYLDGIYAESGKPLRFEIFVSNRTVYPKWIDIKWWLPDNFEISPCRYKQIHIREACQQLGSGAEFTVTPNNLDAGYYDILVQVSAEGHPTTVVMPIRLIV